MSALRWNSDCQTSSTGVRPCTGGGGNDMTQDTEAYTVCGENLPVSPVGRTFVIFISERDSRYWSLASRTPRPLNYLPRPNRFGKCKQPVTRFAGRRVNGAMPVRKPDQHLPGAAEVTREYGPPQAGDRVWRSVIKLLAYKAIGGWRVVKPETLYCHHQPGL